jgi:hypothetical protein
LIAGASRSAKRPVLLPHDTPTTQPPGDADGAATDAPGLSAIVGREPADPAAQAATVTAVAAINAIVVRLTIWRSLLEPRLARRATT